MKLPIIKLHHTLYKPPAIQQSWVVFVQLLLGWHEHCCVVRWVGAYFLGYCFEFGFDFDGHWHVLMVPMIQADFTTTASLALFSYVDAAYPLVSSWTFRCKASLVIHEYNYYYWLNEQSWVAHLQEKGMCWVYLKWRIGESNPRPPACKAGALPTELIPLKE